VAGRLLTVCLVLVQRGDLQSLFSIHLAEPMTSSGAPRRAAALTACCALLLHCLPARATDHSDHLKRCLASLDGIAWQLPYLPKMQVHGCELPGTGRDASAVLDLIGEVALGSLPLSDDSDLRFAQVQQAVYVHFDALFRRHGYHRIDVGYRDLRNSIQSGTAPLQGIGANVFVNMALYQRQGTNGTLTLRYSTEAANTWRIRIDGLPAASGKNP
jgi:hypothetical protein